ncbi:MAG TPA: GGDEF domain-containing protein [Terracidiphilus sp.]|nr:GGDEF domain-containing protein [Terracidiphilus sp.]
MSILWGYGTGSRLARMLALPLLLLPLFREILRAHMLKTGLIPARYAGAVLVSVGTVLTVILLLVIARVINRMQENVQELTLRDELTGLHSVKGFYLLAEQAFRYSRRVNMPFGVLFVDMDNLKIINDQLGHSVGSVSLVETAKLLQANFRETDVIGRVGGDEFIVAGQFAEHELLGAMERLRLASIRKNQAAEQRFSISLSLGYAVTEDCAHDNLRNLVKRADEAMYIEKRAKKKVLPPMAIPSEATH